jgi:hypothetical protein
MSVTRLEGHAHHGSEINGSTTDRETHGEGGVYIILCCILILYTGYFDPVCHDRKKGAMMRRTAGMIGLIAGIWGFVASSVPMLTVSTGFASDIAAPAQAVAPPLPSQNEPFSATMGLGIIGRWSSGMEGDRRMELDPAPTGFKIVLHASGPSGCTGLFESTGSLSGNTITLSEEKDGRVCTIAIKFKTWDFAEVSESNCSAYHGAACSFRGTLKRED